MAVCRDALRAVEHEHFRQDVACERAAAGTLLAGQTRVSWVGDGRRTTHATTYAVATRRAQPPLVTCNVNHTIMLHWRSVWPPSLFWQACGGAALVQSGWVGMRQRLPWLWLAHLAVLCVFLDLCFDVLLRALDLCCVQANETNDGAVNGAGRWLCLSGGT
jgi:hypothetical protein